MKTKQTIPVIEDEVSLSAFSNSDYLISQNKYNYEICINHQTYQLLQLVNGINSIYDITRIYNSENKEHITPEIVTLLLYDKLSKYGIIKNKDVTVEPLQRANYLKLSTIIIPANIVNKIADIFTPLFYPFALKIISIIAVLFIIVIGVNHYYLLRQLINDFLNSK